MAAVRDDFADIPPFHHMASNEPLCALVQRRVVVDKHELHGVKGAVEGRHDFDELSEVSDLVEHMSPKCISLYVIM